MNFEKLNRRNEWSDRLHSCHDINAFVRWLASIPNLKPVGRVIQK